MYRIKQVWLTAGANFRQWRRNPQVWLAFGLGFVICFLLSNKVVLFSQEHNTMLQVLEPFIWTFGDANSILLVSLCLLLLFADIPNVGNEVPFFLVRMSRMTWMLGQILYQILGTLIFVGFILVSTCILAGLHSYSANLWSDTAAVLGYSQIGNQIAIPAFVKVLELSFPYSCMLHIFGLMLGYSVFLSGLILYLNLWKGNYGMMGGILFSGFGFLMNPTMLASLFHISRERMQIANILFGWLSPLNHATYYMHNFGYDNLPKLWVSYVFFIIGSLLLFGLSLWKIRNYSFSFTGTQR
ncbi:MAG: hypothetical protein NC089_07415 [Bacteroides sp.]|nr:hypothetical protein [Bacteroides sp.]MCM1549236.1 hypothetical protein [Clostridium sp.]